MFRFSFADVTLNSINNKIEEKTQEVIFVIFFKAQDQKIYKNIILYRSPLKSEKVK